MKELIASQTEQLNSLSTIVQRITKDYELMRDEIVDLGTAVAMSEQSAPIAGLDRFPAHLQDLYALLHRMKCDIESADTLYVTRNIMADPNDPDTLYVPDFVKMPDDLERIISGADWRFARTYPTLPHEYTTFSPDKMLPSSRRFLVAFAKYIMANGYDEVHWGKTWRYLNVGEYKYWLYPTADESEHDWKKCDLINRTLIDDAKIAKIKEHFANPANLVKNAFDKDCAPYGFNLGTLFK